jgi:hypothetical protein
MKSEGTFSRRAAFGPALLPSIEVRLPAQNLDDLPNALLALDLLRRAQSRFVGRVSFGHFARALESDRLRQQLRRSLNHRRDHRWRVPILRNGQCRLTRASRQEDQARQSQTLRVNRDCFRHSSFYLRLRLP